jgi:hypothetical protein
MAVELVLERTHGVGFRKPTRTRVAPAAAGFFLPTRMLDESFRLVAEIVPPELFARWNKKKKTPANGRMGS